MARTSCICNQHGCGQAVVHPDRCQKHIAELDEHPRRTAPAKVSLTYAEHQRPVAVTGLWRNAHGELGFRFQRSPHMAADLTAERLTLVRDGGGQSGLLSIQCCSCNICGGVELANRYRDF